MLVPKETNLGVAPPVTGGVHKLPNKLPIWRRILHICPKEDAPAAKPILSIAADASKIEERVRLRIETAKEIIRVLGDAAEPKGFWRALLPEAFYSLRLVQVWCSNMRAYGLKDSTETSLQSAFAVSLVLPACKSAMRGGQMSGEEIHTIFSPDKARLEQDLLQEINRISSELATLLKNSAAFSTAAIFLACEHYAEEDTRLLSSEKHAGIILKEDEIKPILVHAREMRKKFHFIQASDAGARVQASQPAGLA